MLFWLGGLSGVWALPETAGGAVIGHAQSLLLGAALASIAGFLLTAVPEFTGTAAINARQTRFLALFWLAGRAAFALSGVLGVGLAALCDLGLLLTLLWVVWRPLWQQSGRRNLAFAYALLMLLAVESGFYFALWRGAAGIPWLRLMLAALLVLVIVSMSRISMRLVNDVLDGQGAVSAPYLARPPRRNLAIWAMLAQALAEFVFPGQLMPAWLALAAAAAVFNLLNDWHVGWPTLRQRWVLIPYLAYVFMGLGYATQGIGRLQGQDWQSAGAHLQLVGTLGLSMLIVMTVAGRMHSGWGLDHRPALPWAAALLGLAALLRFVAGVSLLAAGVLWCLAWALYLADAFKPLTGPRPDDRPGCAEALP